MATNTPRSALAVIRFVGESKSLWRWLGLHAVLPMAFFATIAFYLRFIERAINDLNAFIAQGDVLLYSTLLLVAALVQIREAHIVCGKLSQPIQLDLLLGIIMFALLLFTLSYGLNKASMARMNPPGGPLPGQMALKCRWWSCIGALSVMVSLALSFAAVSRTIRCLRRGGGE